MASVILVGCAHRYPSVVGSWKVDDVRQPRRSSGIAHKDSFEQPAFYFGSDHKFEALGGYLTGTWSQSGSTVQMEFSGGKEWVSMIHADRPKGSFSSTMELSANGEQLKWLVRTRQMKQSSYELFVRVKERYAQRNSDQPCYLNDDIDNRDDAQLRKDLLSGCNPNIAGSRQYAGIPQRRIGALLLPPIFEAVEKRQLSSVKLLLESKAEINLYVRSGFTPLHVAANNGSTEIAMYLLRQGADRTATNDKKQTPEMVAKARGKLATAAAIRNWKQPPRP